MLSAIHGRTTQNTKERDRQGQKVTEKRWKFLPIYRCTPFSSHFFRKEEKKRRGEIKGTNSSMEEVVPGRGRCLEALLSPFFLLAVSDRN
jgi:hypothetical protein